MQDSNRGGETQRWKGGAPPNQRVRPVHGLQEREGGGATKRWKKKGNPLISVRSSCTAYQLGRGGGGNHEGEGEATPDQYCTPFMRGLIQEIGGGH